MRKIILGLYLALLVPFFAAAEINPWQKFFTEPCEIVYFIMKDGQPFRVSSGGVKSIHVPIEELKKRLKDEKEAYEIKDIAIIIHNHRTKARFLEADRKFYRDLKRRGFNGQFLMYCHRTNKTYDIEAEINPWQKFFTDPFEKVYVIMKDGATFPHTSGDDAMVDMSIGRLEETLKKVKGKNYSIKEIKIVIHNHRRKNYFTRSDYKQYWMLKKYGFNGKFLLYCHRTKEVYDIEEKKEK